MDYSNWPQIQPNPSLNPDYSVLHNPNQSVGYPQNFVSDSFQVLNVHSHTALFHPPPPQPQPQPPGVDTQYMPPPMAVNYVHQPIVYEAQQGVDAAAAAAAYYPDPNVTWVTPTPQFGTTPYATGISVVPSPAIQPEMKNIWKSLHKKTKVVQSAWCEVCKIDCNSKGVLDQHKLGKKHLKNLQKLKVAAPTIYAPIVAAAQPSASIAFPPTTAAAAPLTSISTSTSLSAPNPTPTPSSTVNPFIGPPLKPKSQKSRKKAAARTENLETKRRKVLEGGAAADAVRLCSICNVVCNSDTVYNYHIAGQKHASMAKKLALGAGLARLV